MNKPVMPELPEPTTAEGWYSERDVVEHGEAVEAAWSYYAAALEARLREVEGELVKSKNTVRNMLNPRQRARYDAAMEQSNG